MWNEDTHKVREHEYEGRGSFVGRVFENGV